MNKLKLFGTVGIIGSCIVGYFVGRHAGLKRCDEMLKHASEAVRHGEAVEAAANEMLKHAEEAVMHTDVIEKIYEDMDPKILKTIK